MSLPLHLLLVEDREDDEILISRAFARAGFLPRCQRVQTAETLAAALRARSDWAALLCDSVPCLDVHHVVSIARGARPALPIVVVSGREDREWRTAIERLADAFIRKDRLEDVPAIVKGLQCAPPRCW